MKKETIKMDETRNVTTNPEADLPDNVPNDQPEKTADDNVIQFPTKESANNPNEDGHPDEVAEEKESFNGLIDPSKPITQRDIDNVGRFINQFADTVRTIQKIWLDTKAELKLTDTQIKAVYNFNIQNRDPEPDPAEGEDAPEYDRYNGVLKMTDADITNVFGDGHPIWGVDLSQTRDRIHGALQEFIEYAAIMKEFRDLNNNYAKLQNMYEDDQMEQLQKIADEKEDPTEKAELQRNIDNYWRNRYLGFLTDPVDEATINRIVLAYSDRRKCEYWRDRSLRKMKQLHMSPNFLMELYNFEEIKMDEKYAGLNNILLLYFMHTVTYINTYDKDDIRRPYSVFMFNTLDNLIQNRIDDPEKRQLVLDNVATLLDNFMGKLPEGAVCAISFE